jgi:hypothetical protein
MSLTDDTPPRTINALLTDPRTDSDTGSPAPGQDTIYHSAPAPVEANSPLGYTTAALYLSFNLLSAVFGGSVKLTV